MALVSKVKVQDNLKEAIEKAAVLTAYYSDQKSSQVLVRFGKNKLNKTINVSRPSAEDVDRLRIT